MPPVTMSPVEFLKIFSSIIKDFIPPRPIIQARPNAPPRKARAPDRKESDS